MEFLKSFPDNYAIFSLRKLCIYEAMAVHSSLLRKKLLKTGLQSADLTLSTLMGNRGSVQGV